MRSYRGFTLIELLVVVAIIGILASIIYVNFGGSTAVSRDAKRQSDLRNLQTAIESYKQRYGYYPAGCRGANNWSGGTYGCPSGSEYIVGLVPEFISRLPYDPKPGTGSDRGYVYVSNRNATTNTGGTVYKLMAMNTVESETVTYEHEFKSCDIWSNSLSSDIEANGWCGAVYSDGNNHPVRCRQSGADGRFDHSYGVWGGFELVAPAAITSATPLAGLTTTQKISAVRNTTAIICK